MPMIVTLPPVISPADTVNFTITELAGVTAGMVVKLASAPPSVDTLKSPAAMVGFDWKLPGVAMLLSVA